MPKVRYDNITHEWVKDDALKHSYNTDRGTTDNLHCGTNQVANRRNHKSEKRASDVASKIGSVLMNHKNHK